ncbi:hypothetical protein CW749_26385 [Vibrio sp. vnigr-6D03]|uniref:hypothetical protein n=1 Tax=Vibrio sp. vnigr-6D03 TaxID=2058088 RepID=UPI000C325356|nr:hypothetical protein [Vibrio sp. vnigr-6D03]PKF76578.1 hypothetical protein CW749_26385 [Vibrio sp. vnigr-6D03]
MFKNSIIPAWVNVFMLLILFFMSLQVYWFYFDHSFLAEAGISLQSSADYNIIYTTAGRLLAMIVITLIAMATQSAQQYMLVLSIFREGQETVIDPLFPYLNSPASPMADLITHLVIVALEVTALIVIYRRTRQMKAKAKFAR